MQYAKTLLGISLILATFHAQAQTQSLTKDNPSVTTPNSEMQIAHSNETHARTPVKNAKAPANRSPSKMPGQNRPYEIPLSDYVNGGHFGN